MKVKSLEDLERLRRGIIAKREPNKPVISVCVGTGCVALKAERIMESLNAELEKQNLKYKVEIKETGCLGSCELGPIMIIYPEEICYLKVKPKDVPEIVSKTVLGNQVIERLLYRDPTTDKRIQKLEEIPFYKYQFRLLLGNNARMDPKNIEDYIALGGYSALTKALFKMTSEQIIEEVKKANLRGRGGGGFPTAIKWETTRNTPEEPKYVIVNCDEGDPGAFMDRALVEGTPHSVLEGFIIGAYAIGAHDGYVYVRGEYPLAVENISRAIKQAEEYGLLGENIMGSGFSFRVKVQRGAGAFVSGESTALISAIEGKAGEPRPKYVHTSVKGIQNKPTCLNNVKTWANVPPIILRGGGWFRKIGSKSSSGTMIFSLVGKIKNTGLVEVPMGITLRDLVYKIGGGIRGEKKFKAVQIGGPSGGFIPEAYLDLPVDFDELAKVGSMMGSGGMVVMDEDICMVDAARFFIDFLLQESCGKCTPCREGLRTLSKILNRICEGEGEAEDLRTIEDIVELMKEASLCQLGMTAVNPILTSQKYFKGEWEQHIQEKRCPAKFCKSLIAYYINSEKCQACAVCLIKCPVKAISGETGIVHVIDQENCIQCGVCFQECRFDAVEKFSPPTPPPARSGIKIKKLDEKRKVKQE